MARWPRIFGIACAACSSGAGGTDQTLAKATVEDCKSQFSPSAGYGWESDSNDVASSPDGSAPPPHPPPQERAESDCLGDGQPAVVCDAHQLMTRDAAVCLAKILALPSGITPWKASLTYHFGHHRIVWNVQCTLEDDGQGTQAGETVSIDAIDGTNLGLGSWGATP